MLMIRKILCIALLGCCSIFAGCDNPNGGGVQDFGSVQGRIVDARSHQVPGNVQNATVSIGTHVVRPGANGVFNLSGVPIGEQPLEVRLDGFAGLAAGTSVSVVKNQLTDLQDVQIAPVTPP